MGDFDDINVKINVDASGAEQGITRVSTSLNKLNTDVGKLGTGADFGDKLNSEANQAEGGLDKLGQAAEQANQKLAKIGSGLNLSAVGSQLDALSGKMQSWGAGLSILAAPFELVGAASVNAFADFEAGMGKIFTLLPDITEKGMSEMSAQIKEFSTTFGADLSTVQQAAYDALSSGVSQVDLMPFLETAQAAGVAGMSDVGTAVDGLTSAINAYQMDIDDAGRISDVFFKTVELGKIEFDELSRNIGKVAPTAAQFGISIEDTGAAIAAMTSQGVSAEETMTGLKNLFKDVATPGTQLNKIFQEISGVTFKDFIANGGTLAEAISKLRDYSTQTGKSFFEMGSTFESANALAMLGGGFFEKYAEMTEKVGSAAGSTESAYGKMSDTMEFALDKLKAQFQVMSVDIGEKLAPVVLEFTEWLTENADKISDFAQNVASAAVPAIESIFDILQRGMDMYEKMSPETKSMLAKLIGVGAVGAAVAGPGLLIGGTALSPVASIVKLLGSLKVPATVATEVGAIGTAASTAAGAGGVGALTMALSTIAVPAFGLLFATQADHVMDAVGRLTTDYLRDVRMEVEVQSILGKPDETGFRSWLVEFTKQPIEVQIKAVPLLGSAYELGEQFSQDLFLQANNDFSQNTVLKNKFNQFQAEAKTAVEAAGESVKTFSHRDVAEMNNYLAKSTGKIKELGITTTAQFDTVKGFGGIFNEEINRINANVNELSKQTGESVESIRQRLINGDFTPVQFKDGTIFYTYQNNVLKPIESDPLLIGIDEGKYQEGFARVKAAYDDLKQYIASNKIEADINISKSGDISQTQGTTPAAPYNPKDPSTWSYSKGAVTYAKDTETATQTGAEVGSEAGAEAGAKAGIESAIPSLRSWVEGMGKQGLSDEELHKYQSSYDKEFPESQKSATVATEAETEAKEKGTKALTNYTGSLEEATRASIEANAAKFTLDGKTYAIDLQTGKAESQDLADIIARNQADALAKEAEKQSKELEAARVAAGKQTKAISDKLEDYIESYTSAISKLKPGETNTEALKKLKSSIEELNSDYNVSIPTDLSGAREALKQYEIANADTTNAINAQTNANTKLSTSSNIVTDRLSNVNDAMDKSSAYFANSSGTVSSSIKSASSEFQNLSNRAQNLETQYKSGRITQDDYIESIKELSREYDTLSRNTNTFKGEEKDAVEGYIRNLKNLINHYEYGTEPAEKYLDKIIALNDAWLNSASVIESTVESINASVDKSGKYQPEAGTEASKALEDLSKLKTAVYGESVDSAKNFEEWVTEQTYKRLTTYINAGWDEAAAKLATEGDIYADYLQYRGGVASMPSQAGYGATRRTYAQEYYDEGGKAIAKAFADAMFEDDIYSKIKSGQYTASREFEGDKNDPLMWRRIDIVDKEADAISKTGTEAKHEDMWNKQEMNAHVAKQYTDAIKGLNDNLKSGKITTEQYKDHVNTLNAWQKSIKVAYSGVGEVLEADKAHLDSLIKSAGITPQDVKIALNAAETTTPQINTLNLALEKTGLTGSALTDILSTVNRAISDHNVNIQETRDYLKQYNDAAGENVKYTKSQEGQTKDLMNAYSSISTAQDLYNKYMDDGKLSAEEATTVQAALAQGIDLMGTAGADTADKIANMPPALTDLASSISDFLNQIKSSVNSAMQDTLSDEGWKLATTDKYETIGESTKIDISKALGLDSAENVIDNVSKSTGELVNKYQTVTSSGDVMNSTLAGTSQIFDAVTNAASNAISRAQSLVASAQSIASATVSRQYSNSYGLFQGARPGWRDPSPCGWGVAFESGGPVANTGPAMVHQGEWILNRNDVRNMSKQRGNEVKLTVDMRNSRFGNADLAKDLPNKIARAMTRVKIAGGM